MLLSSTLSFLSLDIVLTSAIPKSFTRRNIPDPGIDAVVLAARHNISCVGQHYDLELPLQSDWNPNTVSVQELCAKTKYGGGPSGRNLGGWCDHDKVVFDYGINAEVNPQLSVARVHLGCLYRCFCNYNISVDQRSVQPKPSIHQPSLEVTSTQSHLTYEIQLDIINDFTAPAKTKRGRLGTRRVPSLRKSRVMESEKYEGLFNAHHQYISQDLGNSIHCAGPLPTFVLPHPYNHSDFGNLQQLCAVQLSGGLLGANAGGFCYRSDAIGNGGRTVWFSDEMTPRLDWTWAGGNFFAAASIRMHCIQYCRCNYANSSATNVTYLGGLWNFVSGAQLALLPSGQIDLTANSNSPSINVLPAQNGPGSASGTCGTDGKQFCRQEWPMSLLGPIPQSPPDASDIVRPGPNPGVNNNITTCGNTCQGPQDCGPGDDEKACVCAIPNEKDAKALGIDPVFPIAFCLVLMHSNFGGTGALIGRTEQPYRCLCNATFVHGECCGSKDGMIWSR